MESKTRQGLKGRAQSLEPTLRVGKEGMKETLAEELKRQLKEKKLVKVRVLKGVVEDIANKLADATGATVVEVRGKTIVFWKK
jgi:RNA-binding protein